MSRLIQSPSPVPPTSLVVKNASQRRDSTAGLMPLPLSATVMVMTAAACLPVGTGAGAQYQRGYPAGHGVQCIIDEVAEYLTDLSIETDHRLRCAKPLSHPHVAVQKPAGIDPQCAGDEVLGVQSYRAGGLLVKAQGLAGNCGDAAELGFGLLKEDLRAVPVFACAREKEEISHSLQRIVDFVRHGRGEASHRGEFFGGTQQSVPSCGALSGRRTE